MNKKLFKLPFLTAIGGIILRIINHFIILIMVRRTNEWTLQMGTAQFYIELILSILIFVLIGIILRKTYYRKDFLKSSTLLVIYSIIVLILEQVAQNLGIYNIGFSLFLYLPIEIFTIITSVLSRLSSADVINLLYVIPSTFAPYLFIVFGKKSKDIRKIKRRFIINKVFH